MDGLLMPDDLQAQQDKLLKQNKPEPILMPGDLDSAARNLRLTDGIKSPQAVQALKHSQATGFSPNLALDAPDEMNRMVFEQNAATALKDAPNTQSLLAGDPIKAATYKDDIERLSSLEKMFRTGPADDNFVLDPDNELPVITAAFKQAVKTVPSFAKSTNEALAMTAGALDSVERGLGNLLGTGSTGVFGTARDWLIGQSEYIRKNIMESEVLKISPDKRGRLWDNPEYLLDPEWLTYNVGEAASSMVPMLTATYLTGGNALVGAAVGGAQEAGDLFRELISEGTDPDRALVGSTIFGVGTAYLNKLGLDRILDKTVTKNALIRAAKSFTAGTVEGITEYLEEPLQALMQGWAEGQTPEKISEMVMNAFENIDVIPGAMLFGGAVSYTGQYRGEQMRAEYSKAEHDFLDKLDTEGAAPALAQHDPILYQEALRVLKDGGKITDVYVPADRLLEALGNGEQFAKMLESLGVAEQWDAAIETGGDLRIPIENYLKVVATDSNFAPMIADDRRLTSNGFTRRELTDFQQKQAAELKELMGALQEEQAAEDADVAEGQEIYKLVKNMRLQTGMATEAATADAAQMAAWFVNMAKQYEGVTPMQLFEKYGPAEVRGPQADAAQGQLNQDDIGLAGADPNNAAQVEEARRLWAEMGTESPYFKRWSGGAPVVGRDAKYKFKTGEAVVVEGSHGSPDARGLMGEDAQFKSQKEIIGMGRELGVHWFTPSKQTAKSYADPRRAFDYQNAEPGVVDAYILMRNPLVIDGEGKNWRDAQKVGRTGGAIETAMEGGHDGLIVVNVKDDYNNDKKTKVTTTYAVFSPTQIKSVNNRGTFDATDPRILMQDAASTGATPDARQEYFKHSKVRGKEGNLKVLFHGAQRADRVSKAEKFSKERATSGPMAFFTDDPEIASGYATGKSDTSLEVDSLEPFFKVNGKSNFTSAWYGIDPLKRFKIKEMAHRIGLNDDTGAIEIVLRENENSHGLAGRSTFEYELKQAGGNVIKALYELWVSSGAIFGEEVRFVEVLRAAGIEDVVFDDPYATFPGVFPVYVNITNPLDTSAIPKKVVAALKKAAKLNPDPEYTGGVDGWDKRGPRGAGKNWFPYFEEDLKRGETLAWTVIPDWVTAELKRMGYDGIKDTGGKHGGRGHEVWVPFEENQVKSVFNQNPTSDPRIMYQAPTKTIPFDPLLDGLDGGWTAEQVSVNVNGEEVTAPAGDLAKALQDRMAELKNLVECLG